MDIIESVKELAPGESLALPVQRDPDFKHMVSDTVAATISMAGQIVLTALAARTRAVSQDFVLQAQSDESAALSSGNVMTQPEIVELGAIQISPETASRLAVILARHSVRGGIDAGDMRERLQAEDWF